jgi:hypothetical protein
VQPRDQGAVGGEGRRFAMEQDEDGLRDVVGQV